MTGIKTDESFLNNVFGPPAITDNRRSIFDKRRLVSKK
jgi:hypothetical protein